MENEERKTLKAHILKKIKTLKEDIRSFQTLSRPVAPDNAIGRLTRMEAIGSKSMNEAALRRAKETLSKLEQTLKTIDSPDFGLCGHCEEPVPFARLMVMPEAEVCVECAEKLSNM